eukprot:COSAG02_NODE_13518_length_1384_cov_0.655253_1_plen_103_part_00
MNCLRSLPGLDLVSDADWSSPSLPSSAVGLNAGAAVAGGVALTAVGGVALSAAAAAVAAVAAVAAAADDDDGDDDAADAGDAAVARLHRNIAYVPRQVSPAL